MNELLVTRDGPCTTWALNRPSVRNALDPALVAAMRQALVAAESGPTEVVIIRGEGSSFCAGADLRFLQTHDSAGPTPRAFLEAIWDLTLAMERSDVVFVAALHGHAIAGGLEIALACDVVVAAEGTLIGDGHVRNNLLPGGGASARMERALGRAVSAWLAMSGAFLPAEDRRLAGWLHEVTPAGLLDEATGQVAVQLLTAPRDARRRYKRLLNEQYGTSGGPDESDRDRELDTFDRHWREQNVPIALRRFLERNGKAS